MACSTVCGSPRMVTVRITSSGLSASMAPRTQAQPSSHQRITSARVVAPLTSNSWSRKRSGFSPSLVRKSVKRERILPARCFTRIAIEFDSGSSVRKKSSSRSCAIAPSPMRLYPRICRRASSIYWAARSIAIVPPPCLLSSPPSATGSFNRNPFALAQASAELAGHRLDRAIVTRNESFPWGAVRSSCEATRSARAPIGQQRHFAVGQHLNLADNAVAAAKLSLATAARAQRIPAHPQRICILQRLRRGVQGVRHVGVHSRNPSLAGPSAHSSGNGLVISEGLARARIDPADGQVVHRPRRRSRDAIGNGLRQRPQYHVDDSLRRLDVPSSNCRRRPRVHDGPLRRNDLDRPHQPCRCRNVLREQAAKHIEARRISDRSNRVDAPLNLRVAARKIDSNHVARTSPSASSVGVLAGCRDGTLPSLLARMMNCNLNGNLDRPLADSIAIQKILCPIRTRRHAL